MAPAPLQNNPTVSGPNQDIKPSTDTQLFRDVDDLYEISAPDELPLRERVDWYLNEPASIIGRFVELTVGGLILIVCVLFILTTLDVSEELRQQLRTTEKVISFIFLIEYLVRWWAKDFSFRYLLTPMALIDLAAIVPLVLGPQLQLVRLLRFFRVLRLLRLVQSRRFFFGEVTPENLIVLRIGITVFCLVFVTGGSLYELEHGDYPETWPTLFDGIYFAVVTLTTVGFGDVTPHTVAGKMVTMVMILIGVLVIPWQLTTLAKRFLYDASKVRATCRHCGLTKHDTDASHCKSCGEVIFQEYEGDH